MGIPGGSKQEGIRQLESAMNGGGMTAAEARFYLAKNLRTYDQQYERAAVTIEPLTQKYPRNAVFNLFLGNFNLELNRREKAVASLQRCRGSGLLRDFVRGAGAGAGQFVACDGEVSDEPRFEIDAQRVFVAPTAWLGIFDPSGAAQKRRSGMRERRYERAASSCSKA